MASPGIGTMSAVTIYLVIGDLTPPASTTDYVLAIGNVADNSSIRLRPRRPQDRSGSGGAESRHPSASSWQIPMSATGAQFRSSGPTVFSCAMRIGSGGANVFNATTPKARMGESAFPESASVGGSLADQAMGLRCDEGGNRAVGRVQVLRADDLQRDPRPIRCSNQPLPLGYWHHRSHRVDRCDGRPHLYRHRWRAVLRPDAHDDAADGRSVRYVRTLSASDGAGRADHTTHDVVGVYGESHGLGAPPSVAALRRSAHESRSRVGRSVTISRASATGGARWAASFHTDTIASGTGHDDQVNIEPTPMAAGRVIGLNIQTTSHKASLRRAARTNVNIQSGPGMTYGDGVLFDGAACGTGIRFRPTSHGARAIAIEGSYPVGMNLGGSAPHACRYAYPARGRAAPSRWSRTRAGRSSSRNRSRVLGYIVTDATASGGRLN